MNNRPSTPIALPAMTLRLSALLFGVVTVGAAMLPLLRAAAAISA